MPTGEGRPDPGGQGDVLQFGRDRPAGRRRRARGLLGCVILAVALLLVIRTVDRQAPASSRRSAAGIEVASRQPPVRVILVGHRLLGLRASWQLFARGADYLLRIQLAQGRITWTYVPPLETASPAVAFVVGAHETIIQPADIVPGFVVPDGGQARPLTGPLSVGGPVVPGPVVPGPAGSQTVWVTTGPATLPRLSLVTLSGHRVGPNITVPPGAPQIISTAVSDGRGDVLLTTSDYADYDAGPGWVRAEPGTIIAVGPASWLTEVCGAAYPHCRYEVINAFNGHRRTLPEAATQSPYYFTWPPAGVIAPDGSTAAVAENGSGGATTVHLINLRTGVTRDLGFRLAESGISAQGTMAWSPDGRWLFVATAAGQIVVIDPRTGRAESLGVGLPDVSQVAIRA
jgi:hypothetical protein